MSPLRKQMQEAMVLRGLAARTQESYIAAVAGIARYYRRSPDTLSSDEVERYLLHLIEERKLSWSTTNQAASALMFLDAQEEGRADRHTAPQGTGQATRDIVARRGHADTRSLPHGTPARPADDHLRSRTTGVRGLRPEGGRY